MTSISIMELKDRMEKRLIETKEDHNKLIRSLNKHNQRILKNLRQYSDLELSPIKIEDSLNELINKLDTNIKSAKIKIINNRYVDIDEVFRLYYNCEPPFSSKEKKRFEFPDAFILKSVDNWCKKNKTKMIFLTNDNDFNGYKSRNLLFRNDAKNLLGEISRYYDSLQQTQIIPFITKQIETNMEILTDLINSKLKDLVVIDLDYEKVSNIDFEGSIKGFETTAIRSDYAEVSCKVELKYKFTLIPTLYDLDREIFEDKLKHKRISGTYLIPCDMEVGLERRNDVKVKWINSNQKIRIGLNN